MTHNRSFIYYNVAAVTDDDGTHAWLSSSCCNQKSSELKELEGEEERDRECTNQQKTAGTKQSRAWSGRNDGKRKGVAGERRKKSHVRAWNV